MGRVPTDLYLAVTAANRNAITDDVDGDPVFLATSDFMLRRTADLAPALTFRDVKDVRAVAA